MYKFYTYIYTNLYVLCGFLLRIFVFLSFKFVLYYTPFTLTLESGCLSSKTLAFGQTTSSKLRSEGHCVGVFVSRQKCSWSDATQLILAVQWPEQEPQLECKKCLCFEKNVPVWLSRGYCVDKHREQ